MATDAVNINWSSGVSTTTIRHNKQQTMDLNRPSPALPPTAFTNSLKDMDRNRARSSTIGTPGFHDRASSFSSNKSPTSSKSPSPSKPSKEAFRHLTRDLLSAPPEILSPPRTKVPEDLDPVKFMPSSTFREQNNSTPHPKLPENLDPFRAMPSSTSKEQSSGMDSPDSRYMSIINGNPFCDSPTRLGIRQHDGVDMPQPASRGPQESWSSGSASVGWPTMSQSKSDGHLAFMHSPDAQQSQRVTFTDSSYSSGDGSPVRGRYRSASPVKHLDDIQELPEEKIMRLGSAKRSRSPMKKMFGENGWLNRSTSMKELSDGQQKKTGGLKQLGEKIRQRVGGITEDVSKFVPSPFSQSMSQKAFQKSKFPVSVDPPTQAKVYSELELMITATANAFLLRQKRAGLITPESLTKVLETWYKKGRPQVIEFFFDQLTQHELILQNLKSVQFSGEDAADKIVSHTIMYNWRIMAKEMTLRTFCQADSAIRRHLHDTLKVLLLLGAADITIYAFQDLQLCVLKIIKDEQHRRTSPAYAHPGVEAEWQPHSWPVERHDGQAVQEEGEGEQRR